jgi:hypothetical protein
MAIQSLVYKHQKVDLKKVEERVHSKFASFLDAANKQDLEKEVLEGAVVTVEVVNREADPQRHETVQEDGAS